MNTNTKEFENLSVEKFDPVSTCLCPKYIKCCFQNFVNVREDENERIIHNDFQLIITLINFVPCSEFFISFPFFNLILPQTNHINAVICRQLNIKILKKLLFNAIKE